MSRGCGGAAECLARVCGQGGGGAEGVVGVCAGWRAEAVCGGCRGWGVLRMSVERALVKPK